jgi:hypothetical protein
MKVPFAFINLLLSGILSFGLLFPDTTLTRVASNLAPDNLPTAIDDTFTTNENTLLNVPAPGVLQNDISYDPGTLLASLVTGTSQGMLTLNPNGSFTYNPDANFSGTDVFTYTATDSYGTSNQARVTLTVSAVNYAPAAVDDQVSTREDTPVIIDVLSNDSDPDGNLDPTSVSIVTGAAHGTTSVDPLTGKVTYSPSLHFYGQDGFAYKVCDTLNACSTANVIIDVLFVNHPPVANDDQATTLEDVPVVILVTANDIDIDGNLDPSTVKIVSQSVHGSTIVDPSIGSVTYFSNSNYNGADSFSYQVCDIVGACSTANVSITVTPVNDPPVATDDSTSIQDPSVTVDVLANDTDPDGIEDLLPSSVTVITPPITGTATVNTDNGSITYTPNSGFWEGIDTFRYQVCDHGGLCAQANVTIDVTRVNQPPVANPDSDTTLEDTPLSIGNVAVNDTDLDNNLDPKSVTIVRQPTNGSATMISPKGTILYTPNPNFNGMDEFTYQICDTGKPDPNGSPPLCASAEVTITVTPVNDAPVAMADTYFMDQDTILTVAAPGVLENDSDVDNSVIYAILELEQGPAHGKLDWNKDNNGSFSYIPEAGFAGQDTFTYHAFDGSLPAESVMVTITVYDTQAPEILQWLQPPVKNHSIYSVTGPTVTLEVAASDNAAIDHVRFSRWDPVTLKHVDIASVQGTPYIYVLDANTLRPGFNQVYARAYDTSGNDSGQDNYIYLDVKAHLFLPVLIR